MLSTTFTSKGLIIETNNDKIENKANKYWQINILKSFCFLLINSWKNINNIGKRKEYTQKKRISSCFIWIAASCIQYARHSLTFTYEYEIRRHKSW